MRSTRGGVTAIVSPVDSGILGGVLLWRHLLPFGVSCSEIERAIDRAVVTLTLWALRRWSLKLVDGCLRTGVIDLLGSEFRHWTERVAAGNLISVAVGGDDSCSATPTRHCLLIPAFRE